MLQKGKVDDATDPDARDTTTGQPPAISAEGELIALLKDQLAKAEARAEREAEDRRRMEGELSALRAEIQRLLPSPTAERPVGFWGRLFSRH
ncbi:MAG TPA: hypothetical protein VK196_09295 [Magnetospirillum sp.]|nr:hypothetical protein [Magnetospirillum sp.]